MESVLYRARGKGREESALVKGRMREGKGKGQEKEE